MRCGVGCVGWKVIVCCAVMNEKRVEGYDGCPEQTVQCSQASCLRSRTFNSDFAARELLCKRTRTKLELPTDCRFPCRSVIDGVLGAVKLWCLYRAFALKNKDSLSTPTLSD